MQKIFPSRRSPLARAVIGLGLALAIQSALAQDLSFDIAAQPLPAALSVFARQTGLQLAFPPELVQGKQGHAVAGARDVRSALNELLSGTGLQGDIQGKTLVIQPVPASSATTLATVTVAARADGRAISEGSQSYAARGATIGKMELALKEIPQSVSVVTRQRMDDQNLTTLGELLDHTTGITTLQTPAGGKSFAARGFNLNTVQYDGVPLSRQRYSSASHLAVGTAFLDRVEVLRGAQGLLEGAGSPGGAVNLVRKRGTDEKQVLFTGRAGSWDHYGGQLDVAGPLNEERTLRGRAVVDYDDQHSYVDIKKERNLGLYAALDYDLSRDTTIGVGFSATQVRATPFFWGVPRYSNRADLGLDRSTFLGARWNRWSQDEKTVFFDLEHRFNDDWRLKVAAIHIEEENYQKYMVGFGAVNPTTRLGTRGMTYEMDNTNRHSGIDANLQGRFEAWGLRHSLTVGANASRLTSRTAQSVLSNVSAIDVFAPNPDVAEPSAAAMAAAGVALTGYDPITQRGAYGVLRSRLNEQLTLVLGARASWYDYEYRSGANLANVSASKESGKITPYGGLIYALGPQWSVYASYADIFNPQTARTVEGAALKPEVGANYEAGVKGELLDGALNASLAVFRRDQSHRAVTDYDAGETACGGDYCYRAAGKVRSQGLEAEVNGSLTPNWKLYAGYTYQDLKYRTDAVNAGKRFNPEIPQHILRLWSDYRLPGDWKNLSLGGGVNLQTGTYSSNYNQRQGGYALWNARLAYRINPTWTAAVNVTNLFDKTYYSRFLDGNTYGNYYGTPRSVLVTAQARF
ncbi:MAG: TonB-dependent siderophore receptor [Comamonas sp.]|uniref:TonB-dependent siderophore receptor n=1 Tax=Comamonas sp. TaxID=34028 RepID=UPI002FCBC6D6